MWKKDFGIIIIKPDGVKKNLMSNCEKEILDKGIKIISKKYISLNRKNIIDNFYYSFQSYIEYMTEGEVCVYLLESHKLDLDATIFTIKNKIRLDNNVDGKIMRNYIHGAHCGTEYFMQRKLFFPEYHTYDYSSGADMYCHLEKINSNICDEIKNIDKFGNIKRINFDFTLKNYNEYRSIISNLGLKNKLSYSVTIKVPIQNLTCEVINYLPLEIQELNDFTEKELLTTRTGVKFLGLIHNFDRDIKSLDNVNSLLEYNEVGEKGIETQLNNIIEQLQFIGVKINGILINTSNMKLYEAECRYEYAKKYNYYMAGGSETFDNFGLFGMSFNKYEPLSELFY